MSTPTIKIAVSQADATLVQATTLTSGMQNLPVVKFYFTDEWAGLGKTAVFIAGSVALEVLVVNNQAVVPAECLETAGVNLTVGIYGANTQIVLPTVYCSCGEILTGTDVEDASNVGEPTTELVAQMLAYAAEIEAVADTLDNLAIRTVHVNTDGANHYGIASVTLSDTGSGEDRTLTFAFSNLKGNGIESITWSEAGEYRGRIQITESNGTVTNFDALIEAINYLENLINRAEAWAVGTIDGVPVEDIDPDDPAYQNNAKYYAEMAEDAGTGAEAAQEAAETAQGKAEDAQEAAEAAQAAAESAEATATAAASSASGDAGSAAGSASSAASSASDAAASELSAANSRDQALAAAANTHDDAASASASATSAGNSATAASNSSQQSSVHRFMSEAWAVGTMNGTPVSSSAIQYNNHSKYYAGNASADALKAEGNAVGKQNGTDVGSSSPYYHNNAKYYNDQAASSATAAETAQGKAEDAQEAAETAAATFTTDTTLSVSGKAADAKATGDALASQSEKIAEIAVTEEYNDYITDIYTTPYHSGYMAPTGNVSAADWIDYTDKIPVQAGDKLYGETTDKSQYCNFRFVCAFSGNTPVSAKGNSSDLAIYTVPEGIDGVVVSQRPAPSGKTRSVRIERVRQKEAINIKQNPMGYMRKTGNLSDGGQIQLDSQNVTNNVCVVFCGNITSFSKSHIGQRTSTGWYYSYITIDDTNLVVHTDLGDVTQAHGLTISGDIQVLIETGTEHTTKLIRICSNGAVYNDTAPHRWLSNFGWVTAISEGSILTNCVLSWTSRNINAPIWIFGDSYATLYAERWVYHLFQDGFDDAIMLNAYAGEPSEQAYIALTNLIAIRKPQYILWALGMNDADSSTAVNSSWKKYYDRVVSICEKENITLILGTIPNVPTINNSFKNAIIRGSGYRYIEFSKAVDPDEDGAWLGNTLSQDGVHPTADGARVLYMRALADFPELTSN